MASGLRSALGLSLLGAVRSLCVSGGVYECMHMYVLVYSPARVHVEARGWCQVSSSMPSPPYFLRHSLSLKLKLSFKLGWLASKTPVLG